MSPCRRNVQEPLPLHSREDMERNLAKVWKINYSFKFKKNVLTSYIRKKRFDGIDKLEIRTRFQYIKCF